MAINKIICEQFNGNIWRLEIDERDDLLLIEIRNDQEKIVVFGSANLTSGKIHFKDFETPERWLTGMEAAYQGVLLLHYYQSETGPAHKGLMAVNSYTTEIMWTNYAYAFDHLSADGPVLFDTRMQPRKFVLADIKTGLTKPTDSQSIDLQSNIQWPELTNADGLPWILAKLTPLENTVHYLEYNNYKIVSLHAITLGHLTQSLYITDGVNLLYEDLLNTGIQKIQPEAFILHKNRLIYIRNKSTLVVLSV